MTAKEHAYDAGAEAFRAGKVRADCPFPPESLAFLSWVNGWRRAKYEDTGVSE